MVATARDDLYGGVELKLRPVEQPAVLRGDLVIVNCKQLSKTYSLHVAVNDLPSRAERRSSHVLVVSVMMTSMPQRTA